MHTKEVEKGPDAFPNLFQAYQKLKKLPEVEEEMGKSHVAILAVLTPCHICACLL